MGLSEGTWISLTEAARVLGVSYQTMHKMVRLKEIRSLRVRGSIRIERADLEAYIAKNTTGPETADKKGRKKKEGPGRPRMDEPTTPVADPVREILDRAIDSYHRGQEENQR